MLRVVGDGREEGEEAGGPRRCGGDRFREPPPRSAKGARLRRRLRDAEKGSSLCPPRIPLSFTSILFVRIHNVDDSDAEWCEQERWASVCTTSAILVRHRASTPRQSDERRWPPPNRHRNSAIGGHPATHATPTPAHKCSDHPTSGDLKSLCLTNSSPPKSPPGKSIVDHRAPPHRLTVPCPCCCTRPTPTSTHATGNQLRQTMATTVAETPHRATPSPTPPVAPNLPYVPTTSTRVRGAVWLRVCRPSPPWVWLS